MTNEELFTDLKQYLDTRMDSIEQRIDGVEAKMATKDDLVHVEQRLNVRIDGVEERLNVRIDSAEQRLSARIEGVDKKLDRVQDAIADTVTQVAEAADVAIQNHEQQYHGRLKHRAA